MTTNPNFMWCPRQDWGMDLTKLSAEKVHKPVDTIFIHHSVTPATANPCRDMKLVERVGVARFNRFSYSACVHPSGVVLEGAGDRVGAHTLGRNSTAFGLCLIGNMITDPATSAAIASVIDTINIMRATGMCHEEPEVLPHRAVKATACPGLDDDVINFIRFFTQGHA